MTTDALRCSRLLHRLRRRVRTAHLAAQALQRAIYVSVARQEPARRSPSLGPSDFIVREDNVAREVLRVAPADRADADRAARRHQRGGRAIHPRLSRGAAGVRHRARRRRHAGRDKHQIALIALGERPTILTDYTTDPAALQQGHQPRCSRVRQRRVPPRRHHRGQPGLQEARGAASGDRRHHHRGPRVERPALRAGARAAARHGAALHVVVARPAESNLATTIAAATSSSTGTQQTGGRREHAPDEHRRCPTG